MIFTRVEINQALGGILAHSVQAGAKRLAKGTALTKEHLEALDAAGIAAVTIARLDATDLGEDIAAGLIGAAMASDLIETTPPVAGRVNLVAGRAGVVCVSRPKIDAINAIDEAITIATKPEFARVDKGALLATIKIIPYGVDKAKVEAAAAAAQSAVTLAPFSPCKIDLILTKARGFKPSLLDKGKAAVADRIAPLGAMLGQSIVTDHDENAVAEALKSCSERLILVLGASATSDRGDVVPAGLTAAGGQISRFGMPVDPGNLLVLGKLGPADVIGLPGCVRAPVLNGADWVIERLVAGLIVSGKDIAAMGVGGLLKETPVRMQPRVKPAQRATKHVGLLLGAGSSSRMRGADKLLREIDGVPLLRRSALQMLSAGFGRVVVTVPNGSAGHRDALAGLDVTIADVADRAGGMSASIRTGLAGIGSNVASITLGLADMPDIASKHYQAVRDAFDPARERRIVVPVTQGGKRGHPVLFDARFVENLRDLDGDKGAKDLLAAVPEFVHEIVMDDAAVHCDLDTPEAWAAWQKDRLGNAG